MSKETRTVSLDPENHEYLSDQDNASAFVNRLVEQARKGGGPETAAIDLQIRQKEREKTNLEDRLQSVKSDLSELYALKDEFEREEEASLQEARDVLADTEKDADNPAIQNWAKELGMTPTELVEELQ